MSAVGFLETCGRLGAIVATDIALKTANIKLISLKETSGGLVTLIIQGDVAAVQIAIDAAQKKAQLLCKYIITNVIPRPDEYIIAMIKELRK